MRLMKRQTNNNTFLRFLIIPLLASVMACRGREASALVTTVQASELPPAASDVAPAPPTITYTAFKVEGAKSIAELRSKLGEERFSAVLKVNRLDKNHLRSGDTLMVPQTEVSDLLSLSPFPQKLEAASQIKKLVLVSRRAQAFGVYESGKLVRWGPTSTGKKTTPTPAGLYHTNWKARTRISSVNSSWILPWCFNLDEVDGISFHQFDLPGYPASHGCVRLLEEDAKWIFEWAETWMRSKADESLVAHGTPVVIFGDYSYSEKAPWKRLVEDPRAAAVSGSEIDAALSNHLTAILAQARERETLIAKAVPPAQQQ